MATSIGELKKRGPDRSYMNKYLLFGAKIAKIGPVDHEIIGLRAIVTKRRKQKKLTQAKYIAISLLSRLNNQWDNYLACSANLPIGLCILPSVISSFFTMSKAISVSTGPIFTIFTPNGRYLREFS